MHNSIDPLYSAKKVKDMSPTEKKEYKEKTRKIRKESFKKLIWYINYKKIIFYKQKGKVDSIDLLINEK